MTASIMKKIFVKFEWIREMYLDYVMLQKDKSSMCEFNCYDEWEQNLWGWCIEIVEKFEKYGAKCVSSEQVLEHFITVFQFGYEHSIDSDDIQSQYQWLGYNTETNCFYYGDDIQEEIPCEDPNLIVISNIEHKHLLSRKEVFNNGRQS